MSDTNSPNTTPTSGADAAAPAAASRPRQAKAEAPAVAVAPTASPAGESAPAAANGGQQPVPRFEVTAPKPFTGTRNGLDFEDGSAETNDAITAHAALAIGCRVHDRLAEGAAFDSDAVGVAEKLDALAESHWK